MYKKDISILKHIEVYCETIRNTLLRFGMEYEIFESDIDYRNSISMSIMQIGELSTHLSEEFREETSSHIPWRLIKGMRNHFAHGYSFMDSKDIYETAINDIPFLEKQIKNILIPKVENQIEESMDFEIEM